MDKMQQVSDAEWDHQCSILNKYLYVYLIAVLAKAIHSFARIGTELFLEATATNLSLQTMNLTKTSFATISFNSDFFLTYTAKSSNDPNENECKLALKSCLGVFRNMKQVCGHWVTTLTSYSYTIIFFKKNNRIFVGGILQDHVRRQRM